MKKVTFWFPPDVEAVIRDAKPDEDEFTDLVRTAIFDAASHCRNIMLMGSIPQGMKSVPVNKEILSKIPLLHVKKPSDIEHESHWISKTVNVGRNTYLHLEYLSQITNMLGGQSMSMEKITQDSIMQAVLKKVQEITRKEFEEESK